jgi:hypothetical protein
MLQEQCPANRSSKCADEQPAQEESAESLFLRQVDFI